MSCGTCTVKTISVFFPSPFSFLFFFSSPGSELLRTGGLQLFSLSTLETAHRARPRPPRKMRWIMMITGSGGFQHLLTVIKMSASHDKAHFSNTPPSVITRCSPARVQMKNSIQPINCSKSEWTLVHVLLLEKWNNKQTNYSINNNRACVSFIGKRTWGEGEKAPETP